MEDADPKTFTILNNENWINYSRDAKALYCGTKRIEGVDFETFESFTWRFDRDKNRVYIDCEPAPNSDGSTLINLNRRYYKDKKNVYADGVFDTQAFQIQEADADTFEVIGESPFAKDKNFVYLYGKSLEGVDAESFRILGDETTSDYAIDKNAVYYIDFYRIFTIEGADPTTFAVLDHGLSKDAYHVFFSYQRIGDLDPNNFEVIKTYNGNGFYKDKNSVYVGTKKIEGADPATFELIVMESGYQYSKDAKAL